MQNYHKHTYYSNVYAPFKDSHVSYEDYAKRAIELGHKILSCAEHGYQGNYLRVYEVAEKYGLKFVFGVEAYWVDDTEDDTHMHPNAHICLYARNETGRREITSVLSYAQEHTFWRVPRIGLDKLLTLTPENVLITTACVGYWGRVDKETGDVLWNPNHTENFKRLRSHFGESIYLEVQAHNTKWQKIINSMIAKLSRETNTKMIAGLDSHYIFPEQAEERRSLRKESGVQFGDDDHELDSGVYEDYPDDDTLVTRFKEQGILDNSQIIDAMNNTDIFLTFEDIVFNRDKKLPTLYPSESQDQRNERYRQILRNSWHEFSKTIDPEDKQKYLDAIAYEADTITSTGFSDYFLINHAIVKLGREMGAKVTLTSRGSGSSFFTNTLLGLSTIDRITLPVELYPERFVSRERLMAGQLPDVDINTADQDILEAAQEKIMGEGHAFPMVAYGTLRYRSAFKMYARAVNLSTEIQNSVTKQIAAYENELKYTDDDEKDSVDIAEYVDTEYMKYITASEPYRGIVVNKSKASCSYMLYDGDVSSEIGLMRIISSSSKKKGKGYSMCTVIDGYTADDFGFVKNDLLQVDTVRLSALAFQEAGLKQPTSKELIALTNNDAATWDIYSRGITLGINQCEKRQAAQKLMTYRPKNLAELSAFVAAIRPGFKSMAGKFLAREKFEYGVPSVDRLLQGKYMTSSWLLYQEQIMKILAYAGFPMDSTYGIVKAISKKRADKIAKIKPEFLEGFRKAIIDNDGVADDVARHGAEMAWKVIEDSAAYGFNACVAGDTIIERGGRNAGYLPTVEEMFLLKNDRDYAKSVGRLPLHYKYKSQGYGLSLSMNHSGRLVTNRIKDIRKAGVRDIYRITIENGSYIDCTENHKFLIDGIEKRTDELIVGDLIPINGGYEKNKDKYPFTNGIFESNLPIAGQRGFQKIKDGASVKYFAERNRAVSTKRPCDMCGCEFLGKIRFEMHHVDGDRQNNDAENLSWLCVSCHKKIHYETGRVGRFQKGYLVNYSPVSSIEYLKSDMTYDVEMDAPLHTFTTSQGIVTCNSHSVAVALDGLYCAYIKGNNPMAFYKALLSIYQDRKDKDKIAAAKDEMLKGFGIRTVPCKFRQDNRSFLMDTKNNTISDALSSLKGVSNSVAEILYNARNMKFDTFVDVLLWLHTQTMINTSVQETLIRMDYFNEFGERRKLLAIYEEFYNGEDKFSKSHVPATQERRLAALREKEKHIKCLELEKVGIIEVTEQLRYEVNVSGAPLSTYADFGNLYTVVEVNEKPRSPILTFYSARTGAIGEMRARKPYLQSNPLEKGDSIIIGKFSKRPGGRYINGSFSGDGTTEFWLDSYRKVKEEEVAVV